MVHTEIDEEDIRALARELWQKAGSPAECNTDGFWYAAEATLQERARKEKSREAAEASSLAYMGSLVVH